MKRYNNKLPGLLRALLVATLALVMTACVTTETGMFTEKTDDKKAVESSVHLAKKYIGERKWESAKRHLKNALEIDDESASVHEAMALVFQNTGELERAESHYKQSIDLDETLSRARLNYGSFLYKQKRYADAATQLEIVVLDTLYENRQVAYMNLGRCYMSMQRYTEAEKNLKRAYLMRDRHHPYFIFQLADVYYQLKDYPQSQKFYDKYGKQVKTKSAQALLLGARLANQFDDKNAISSYGLALKNLHPRSQQYLDFKREFMHGS